MLSTCISWLLVCGARAAIAASAVPRKALESTDTSAHHPDSACVSCYTRAYCSTRASCNDSGPHLGAIHLSSVLQWRSPTASAPALRCWVAPPHSSPAGQFCMHLPALNAKLFAGLLLLGFAAWQLRRPLQRRLKSQPQRRGLSPRRRQHSWNSCRPRWVKPSHTRQQRALSLCLPLR